MIKRFLYVEDGSVDVDLLSEELAEDTKIIIYRQGSQLPRLVELEEPALHCFDSVIEQKNKEIEQLKGYFKKLEKITRTKSRTKKFNDLLLEIFEECDIE